MEKNDNRYLEETDHTGQVALPFNEDQFKDFIVSLLGKPQTISKYLQGNFSIDKNDLISIFEIINQRIYQQNNSKLIQFRASIYYDDNTLVTLNGFDHLVNYNEKLPLVSKAVHLTWQYLVKFQDKGSFEKQEISLSFLTDFDGPVPFMDDSMRHHYYDSGINFRIAHTARTWGADIEAILTRHLKTIVKKDSKFLRFFRYNNEKVDYVVSATLIGITLIFALFRTSFLKENIADKSDPTFWIHHYGSYVFLFAGIYFLYKLTMVILEEFQFYGAPSFVLLTPESEKAKAKEINNYKKKWLKYLGTLIVSIVLSIVANYIYGYVTT